MHNANIRVLLVWRSFVGNFGVEVCASRAHFKDTHASYPMKLLLPLLVQRYVRLARHTKNTHFPAFCSSNTPTLGTQRQFCCQFWCRGMCVQHAAPKTRMIWHCPFETYPYQLSKDTLVLVHRYVRLAHPTEHTFLALCISNTPILGIRGHSCLRFWCRGMCGRCGTTKIHSFWHCAYQTNLY